MATLLELRDEIILSAGIKGNPDFPPTLLNRKINHAQRYVQTELNGLGMKKWETSQSITAGLTAAAYNSSSNNVKKVAVGQTYFLNMLESPKSIIHIETNDSSDPPNYGIAREVPIQNFEESLANTYLVPTTKKPIFKDFQVMYGWLPLGSQWRRHIITKQWRIYQPMPHLPKFRLNLKTSLSKKPYLKLKL